jgi:SAM-dependent methyltransferase
MFSVAFLNRIRAAELDVLARYLPARGRVLEFGSGTGQQAKVLSERGYDVVAVDVATNPYETVFPVQVYDGRRIPQDGFDAILSSNVLEHVEDLPATLAEFRRVLKPGGVGVHAMPSPAWRAWTLLSGIPNAFVAAIVMAAHLLRPPEGKSRAQACRADIRAAAGFLPIAHGTGGNAFSELATFSRKTWTATFQRNGFDVIDVVPSGMFYTGNLLFGSWLTLERRERLSPMLGSAAYIYVTRPRSAAPGG